jgi:hypothetical protein
LLRARANCLIPCMPSQLHQQTGPHGASPDTTPHQVGWTVKGLAVLSCVGSRGPVADTLLTTDRMQKRRAAEPSRDNSLDDLLLTKEAISSWTPGALEIGYGHARQRRPQNPTTPPWNSSASGRSSRSRQAPTDSPWISWRLHRLEGRMESWHTTRTPTPRSGATRPSCVSGRCGWCWRPWSRPASASG